MIFISYAREDSERADKIFSLLNKPGQPVFYDKESIIPGTDWRMETEEKLNKCSLIIILCSKNSINKEGFVQKEIRMALDRAEFMPDGRIFIIPIRFDGIDVPTKLAKYHWIEINRESDYYDVPFFIDIVLNKIEGSQKPVISASTMLPNKLLLRETVVVLLQGKNINSEEIYTYLQLPLWKLQELRRVMREGQDFSPIDFGVILENGAGQPSVEIAEKMKKEHNMIDVPKYREVNPEKHDVAYAQYYLGFSEAFKSVLGSTIEVPVINMPEVIPEGSTHIQEGIKDGLKVAMSLKQSRN